MRLSTICEAIVAKDPYDDLLAGYEKLQELEARGLLAAGTANELNIHDNIS